MRDRDPGLLAILWLIPLSCLIATFAGISRIGSYLEEQGLQFTSLQEFLFIPFALLINASFTGNGSILLVACLVLVSVVGALISVVFALWATFRSPKKIYMPTPQNQTEGSSSESPRTQTEESSNESDPPPLPLPRRPR